jgi:hypothetical protein
MDVKVVGFGRPTAKERLEPGELFIAWEGRRPMICLRARSAGEDLVLVLNRAGGDRAGERATVRDWAGMDGPFARLEGTLVVAPVSDEEAFEPLLAPRVDTAGTGDLVLMAEAGPCLVIEAASGGPEATYWSLETGRPVRLEPDSLVYGDWNLELEHEDWLAPIATYRR